MLMFSSSKPFKDFCIM